MEIRFQPALLQEVIDSFAEKTEREGDPTYYNEFHELADPIYEKFALDLEVLGMFHTFMKGVDWDDDQWAMDEIIHEVQPGGHHLGTAHTMRHMKTAFFRSELFDYEAAENWKLAGSEDSRTRATRKVNSLIRSYERPPIRNGMEEELREYIEKRKPELDPAKIVG